MSVPISCSVASAVVLEDSASSPRMLLLKRAKSHLRDEWCHVAGGIESGETAWQAALREIREETGLRIMRLYSADYTEQFYEASKNQVTIVPAFVAYAAAGQAVRLNAEHSGYRWVTFHEARNLVTFGGQRRLYEEIEREFVLRAPSAWHAIPIDGNAWA